MAESDALMVEPTSPSVKLSPATEELFTAIKNGDTTKARAALNNKADIGALDASGRSALMRAVIHKREDIALALLGAGADPNTSDPMGDTPYLRSSANGMTTVLSSCLEHGADIKATNRLGSDALMVASENGHPAAVKLLLQHGLSVSRVNDLGWTALHEAAVLGGNSSRYLSVVKLLLEGGADPQLLDPTGKSAVDIAAERGHSRMLAILRQYAAH
ncbi:ankyrin repeat domain-containing protein [Glutamicibacter endophyticus]